MILPVIMAARHAFEKGTATFNAHDIEGFAEVLAADVAFAAPGGARGEGKAACVEVFGGWFTAFPDAHVKVHAVHFIDDTAVEEGTFTGTHNGVLHRPTGDIPPTGRPVSVDYIQVLRFRNGKHVSFNLSFDRLAMLEQLGLAPTPTLRAEPVAPKPSKRVGAGAGGFLLRDEPLPAATASARLTNQRSPSSAGDFPTPSFPSARAECDAPPRCPSSPLPSSRSHLLTASTRR